MGFLSKAVVLKLFLYKFSPNFDIRSHWTELVREEAPTAPISHEQCLPQRHCSVSQWMLDMETQLWQCLQGQSCCSVSLVGDIAVPHKLPRSSRKSIIVQVSKPAGRSAQVGGSGFKVCGGFCFTRTCNLNKLSLEYYPLDFWEHYLNLAEHFHKVAPPECCGVALHSSQPPPSVFEVHLFLTALFTHLWNLPLSSVTSSNFSCHVQYFLTSSSVSLTSGQGLLICLQP